MENGRGKSPYDPKLLTASLLIGEFKSGSAPLRPGVETWRFTRGSLAPRLFHFSRYTRLLGDDSSVMSASALRLVSTPFVVKLFQSARSELTCWACAADNDGALFLGSPRQPRAPVTISFLFNPNY